MKKLLLVACLTFATPVFAILSPLNQSIKEITTILQSQELNKALPQSEPIQDIWHLSNRYIITTENLDMTIDVKYLPATGPGPIPFTLVFGPPKKISG